MLAVKKRVTENLLTFRFRGTTVSYSELLVALENIIIDKVATVHTARKKSETSASMEIGMATKKDSDCSREEGDQRIVDSALQAVYKETGKGSCGVREGPSWNTQQYPGGKGGKSRRKGAWPKVSGKKGCITQRERWQG